MTRSRTENGTPKDWQCHWHDILDTVPELSDEGPRPDPLPLNIRDDSRLLFQMWMASKEARARAFAPIPNTPLVLSRIEGHIAKPHVYLEPQAATDLLREGLVRLSSYDIDRPDPTAEIKVLNENTVSLNDAFRAADTPAYGLQDEMADMILASFGQQRFDVYNFLREPLYYLRNSMTLTDWALWPLCDADLGNDPLEPFYLLECGGWSPGWDSDNVFVFDRRTSNA